MKFRNGEELIKSLNDKKKYYRINKPIWNKICKIKNIYDKGIPFLFEKNYVWMRKLGKLYFKINVDILSKSNFF